MPKAVPVLEGKRVLVLEDEPMLAMLLEEMLIDLGCAVVGPAATVAQGTDLAEGEPLDAAVLDVNLNGEQSHPVAAILRRRGVPYAYATGYGSTQRELDGQEVPILQKPYTASELEDVVRELLRA